MVVAKKYVVIAPFVGAPKKSYFKIVEEELTAVKDGEFLAEAAYFSVDPIEMVIESKHKDYKVGTWVMGHFGWRTHTVVNPEEDEKKSGQKPFLYALPDFGNLPVSLGLGVCGRVGNTAYFGLTQICQPRPGETVVVTGAAGAVGSHVGQIAKIIGCRVIGFAGTDNKCEWLVKELGFDFAGNYKTVDISRFLDEAAPNGIGCYFDNVGGEMSGIIISKMNHFGRVAVCGAISCYNETDPKKQIGITLPPIILLKELRIEGFMVNRFAERTIEGITKNLQWVKEGKIKYKEHIFEGFESAVDAFIGIFDGVNTGKTLVKVK